MKTWKWLIIILVIALLAVYYIMGMDLLKTNRNNAAQAVQLDNLRAEFAGLPGTPAGYEQELETAQAELAAVKSAFPGEENTTRLVDGILQIAEANGVSATPLYTRPWATESVLNITYYVFRLTLSATGDFEHLQDFIKDVENSGPSTLFIDNLKVVRGSAEASANMTAELDIAVFSLLPAAQ